jgi:pilus assembly protein Flp/PilA
MPIPARTRRILYSSATPNAATQRAETRPQHGERESTSIIAAQTTRWLLSTFLFVQEEVIPMHKLNMLRKPGQGLVEYALILVLIAIVVIIILALLGGTINNIFSTIASSL